jgi:hypothetical protein
MLKKIEDYNIDPGCEIFFKFASRFFAGKFASNVQLSEFAIPFGGLQGPILQISISAARF